MLLRKPCKLFASVARVCQRQLGFLVSFARSLTYLLTNAIVYLDVEIMSVVWRQARTAVVCVYNFDKMDRKRQKNNFK